MLESDPTPSESTLYVCRECGSGVESREQQKECAECGGRMRDTTVPHD
jgi:DNA-directed RNA polymerase subunit RPC12/RpoP